MVGRHRGDRHKAEEKDAKGVIETLHCPTYKYWKVQNPVYLTRPVDNRKRESGLTTDVLFEEAECE